jgi:excisionase family DNA binding protein
MGSGGVMSRPFITRKDEKKVKGLLGLLKGPEARQSAGIVEIKEGSARELAGLIELLLEERPIVLEEDLTPSEAAQLAQISRHLIMHLVKSGKLSGYTIGVGKHWKIKRDSILKYIEDRDSLSKAFGELDKAGFGLD